MKIKWYGHAGFKITTEKGVNIIIDPYEPGGFDGAISYGPIDEPADVVITSHDHADHNYVKGIKGSYKRIKESGEFEFQGVGIKTIPVFHDESRGKERGSNLISVIAADGLVVTHLGDLGHDLEPETLKKIGKADIVLMPVGGFFTIDAKMADKVRSALDPAITIPMHYKTAKCAFPIASVEDFTKDKKNVRVLKSSELDVQKATLPEERQIVVLQHAL
jgi:L-ascorbate metabolism protein UlaG (beta-lactamase superfamily)